MKILYVSHYYYPERAAPVSRAMELCRVWRELGHEPIVLTGFPHFPSGRVEPSYRYRLTQREEIENTTVHRTWVLPAANRGIIKRSISFLSFAISAILYTTCKNVRADVVISTSPQLFTGLVGYWISRLRRIPFIFEVRDLWPDSIAALGVVRENVFIRVLRRVEMFLYRKANHIVAVTDHLRNEIIKKGIPPHKVTVFSNGANTDLFKPRKPPVELAKRLGVYDKFVVAYIGNFANAYDFDLVLQVARKLEAVNDIVFFLAGSGIQYERVEEYLNREKPPNVMLHPSVDRLELPNYLALASLALVPLKNSDFFRGHRPCKTFEIMAMEIVPIILLNGEMRELLDGKGIAHFVEPGNAGELEACLRNYFENPTQLEPIGKKARQYIERHFSMRSIGQAYLECLEVAISRPAY